MTTRRRSLRVRLVLVLVVLLALVCAAVGWTTVVTTRHYLLGRLDAQLGSADGRSATAGAPPSGSGGDNADGNGAGGDGADSTQQAGTQQSGARFLLAPGQAAGTLGARLTGGTVDAAAVLGTSGSLQRLSASRVAVLRSVVPGAPPRTVGVGGLGDYRVAATRTSAGDVLITGLPLRDVQRTVHRIVEVELIVAAVAIVVAGGAGAFVIRRTLAPLRRVSGTAVRVSTLPLSRGDVLIEERIDARDVDDRTEVGEVGGAVNRLLDHVDAALTARQDSETRVRRFVADAGHELRTPLTAIRGYAELTRPLRASSPPQVGFALERVEAEAVRMTTMVEDLLTLARLDAGRDLVLAPLELTPLLLDVVSDAVAGAPAHHYELALGDAPLVVTGDADRLHQVFANLLTNARMHTPSGTRVVLRSTVADADAVVTVTDDGPGIAADVLPSVFERFTRGSTARTHQVGRGGSTGLGLSIVRAIVDGHGGVVAVDSRPGETTFTVRLPLG